MFSRLNFLLLLAVTLSALYVVDLRLKIKWQTTAYTKGKEEDFLIKYFSSSGKASKILAKNTDIKGTKQKFKIINSVYDLETKSIKHDIKLVIKKENSKYTVVSLTVDKSSYQKYKDYFDGLF